MTTVIILWDEIWQSFMCALSAGSSYRPIGLDVNSSDAGGATIRITRQLATTTRKPTLRDRNVVFRSESNVSIVLVGVFARTKTTIAKLESSGCACQAVTSSLT